MMNFNYGTIDITHFTVTSCINSSVQQNNLPGMEINHTTVVLYIV